MKINNISTGFTTIYIKYTLECEADKQMLYDIVRNRADSIGVRLNQQQVEDALCGHLSICEEHSLNLDLCGKE